MDFETATNDIQLNSDPGEQGQPDVFGDRVAWADDRHGNLDIYLYDLKRSTEIRVTYLPSNQDQPKLYRDTLVWRDDRNGNYDIYMYDLLIGVETQITYDTADQVAPDIFGTYIVWEDFRNGYGDLYLYDIVNQQEYQLTTGLLNQVKPTLFANTIVYLDDEDGDYEVCSAFLTPAEPDISDGGGNLTDGDLAMPEVSFQIELSTIKKITTDTVDQDAPVIWGNHILWCDARQGNQDIYLYDILTGDEVQLTHNPMDQISPRLYGNKVLWVDFRNGNGDIYEYDIITKVPKRLTSTDRDEYSPVIYDNKIVWVSDIRGDGDIFYTTFEKIDYRPYEDEYLDDVIFTSDPRSAQGSEGSTYTMAYVSIVLLLIVVIFRAVIKKRGKMDEDLVRVPTLREIKKLKKKDELIKACEDLGLNTEGNKKRLKSRLVTFVNKFDSEQQEREEARAARASERVEDVEAKPSGAPSKRKDDGWGNLSDKDFELVSLKWDNGLETSGLIGDREKVALGLISESYSEEKYRKMRAISRLEASIIAEKTDSSRYSHSGEGAEDFIVQRYGAVDEEELLYDDGIEDIFR